MTDRRLAVLGLDAFPYWLLEKAREAGVAPFIFNDKTIGTGKRLSCIPPVTPASWPSMMSGVNPGKHGIFSFLSFDRQEKKAFFNTAAQLEHPRIHEVLSYEGLRSLVVNPIPDFPLLPASKAVIVSNLFFTPRPLSRPRGLHEKYFPSEWPPKYDLEFLEAYVEGVRALLEDQLRDPPPLTWVTLDYPDVVLHKDTKLFRDPSIHSSLWDKIDRLARLLYDNYGNLMIVSDHGFREFRVRVNVNDILYREGYAVPSREETEHLHEQEVFEARGEEAKKIRVPMSLYKILVKLRLEGVARKIALRILRFYGSKTGKRIYLKPGYSIDYERSKAFVPFTFAYGVYTNGADPREVAAVLRRYKGLRVWLREEVYNGPYAGRGPDVVVLGDHEAGYTLGPPRIVGVVYTRTDFATHDQWGILLHMMEDDSINWDSLPLEVPNHLVGSLAMCHLRVPLPGDIDSGSLVEKACNNSIIYKNYNGKFRIAKRLALRGVKR